MRSAFIGLGRLLAQLVRLAMRSMVELRGMDRRMLFWTAALSVLPTASFSLCGLVGLVGCCLFVLVRIGGKSRV